MFLLVPFIHIKISNTVRPPSLPQVLLEKDEKFTLDSKIPYHYYF